MVNFSPFSFVHTKAVCDGVFLPCVSAFEGSQRSKCAVETEGSFFSGCCYDRGNVSGKSGRLSRATTSRERIFFLKGSFRKSMELELFGDWKV